MPRPNVLLIIADSAQRGAYGCYGNAQAQTPVLDQLAREGVRFDRHYTPIPQCHPARASLDTGAYPHMTGQLINHSSGRANNFHIWEDLPSYAGVLRSLGYRTGYVGQQHLRPENFDDVVPGSYTAFRLAGLDESARPDRPRNKFFGTLKEGTRPRDDFTRAGAIDLLRRYSQLDAPWLLQVEYDLPHPSFLVPEKWATLHDPAKIAAPSNFYDRGEGKALLHQMERESQQRQGNLSSHWDETWQALVAHYQGCVSMLDAFTGEILRTLQELKLDQDTLVIYTSDHAELVGAHGVVTKYPMMYDEVMRVPLVARWPGHIKPGQVYDGFTDHTDIWPTLVELGGGKSHPLVQGSSWAALARGEVSAARRDSAYGQLHGYGSTLYSLRMVQDSAWKYVWHPYAQEELYDLKADPGEVHNLAATQVQQRHAMQQLMQDWMKQVDDPLLAAFRSAAV